MSAPAPVLGLGLVLFLAPLAQAQTTWYVDDDNCPGGSGTQADPFCRIQDGILAAASGDTVLVEPGAYQERIDFLGKAITVQSTQGAAVTVVDGGGLGPVVTFQAGEDNASVLDGFTITNGSHDYGGGILAWAAPTLRNNVVTGNDAQSGGGGITCSGPALIQDNEVSFNSSAFATGGIHAYGGATVEGNLIQGNTSGFHNGGISASGGVVRDNRILGNWVYDGGVAGIQCGGGALVEDNLIQDNTHEDSYVGGMLATDCTVRRNLILDNEGGVLLWGDALLENNFIAGNYDTGGVQAQQCSPVLRHNSIVANRGRPGAGIRCEEGVVLTVVDCILWGNQSYDAKEVWVGYAWRPSTVTITHTDLEGGMASCHVEPGCTLTLGPGMVDEDPRFVDAANGDLHLTRDSACINRGLDLGVVDDLDGDARPFQGAPDLGADEYRGIHDLSAGTFTIPIATGGAVAFTVDAQAAQAGRTYAVFVSVLGTNPGMPLPGGQATLPLVLDSTSLWLLKLALRGTPGLQGFVGTLDGAGMATPTFDTQGPLPPAVAGLELAFAWALARPWDEVSNPVRVTLQ